MSKPIVAVVGRPNVGKSTLFNRIVGGSVAIVEDMPGVTRDRLYMDANWLNRDFTLVDTGGIEFEVENVITTQMKYQAELAIREAEVILFVVDGRAGITPDDQDVADILRKTKKPVLLVVNKVEDYSDPSLAYEFYTLGLGDPFLVSASQGLNIGDLLDAVVESLPDADQDEYPEDTIKVAVIGRPNVGKSSLVNALLGEERVIVSDIAGTTRDAIDTLMVKDDKSYVLIDTAGMRKRGKIEEPTERYSVLRSLRAVDRCDVVLMVLDAEEGLAEQDTKIAGYAHDQGRASILVVNKWDLVEKDDKTMLRYTENLREGLGFMQYAPAIYISAKTKQRVHKLFDLINHVDEQHALRINTSVLNDFIRDITALNPPPTDKGRKLKIYYATQSGVKPPTFVLFVNDVELMHFSYQRYIENQLRSNFGFEGTPIRIVLRNRKEE